MGYVLRLCVILVLCTGCTTTTEKLVFAGAHRTLSPIIPSEIRAYGYRQDQLDHSDGSTRHYFVAQDPNDKFSLIYLHGNAAAAHDIIPHFGFVRDRGFSVYIPEYSGYGTNPGKASEATVTADVLRMIKHVRTVSPDRPIVLMGWSLGGTLAVLAAKQEKVDGMITLAAFTRTIDLAPTLARPLVGGTTLDAGEAAKSLNLPWAIVHCQGDETIPFEMSNAFAQATKSSVLKIQPNCDRHYPPLEYLDRALAYIEGELPQ